MARGYKCYVCGAKYEYYLEYCTNCNSSNTYMPNIAARTLASGKEDEDDVQSVQELRKEGRQAVYWGPRLKEVLNGQIGPDPVFLVVYGLPGSGKSTFLMTLANDLARFGRILYVSAEEGKSDTFREKLQRLEIVQKDLLVTSKTKLGTIINLADKHAVHWIFIDSLTVCSLVADDVNAIREDGFHVGVNLHSTKEGGYKGSTDVAHESDAVIHVHDMKYRLTKNRFGKAELDNWREVL